jgi:hypothetical protein
MDYEQLKNERKQGAGKLYRVKKDATLNDFMEHLEKLFHALKPIVEYVRHDLSNTKKDVDRDRIIRQADIVLTMFDDPGVIKPLSEDIHEVIRQWAGECGLANRWVKALKGFADVGGNVKWYDGFPHPGQWPQFELYDKYWVLIDAQGNLTKLKETTKRMLGISRIVNY